MYGRFHRGIYLNKGIGKENPPREGIRLIIGQHDTSTQNVPFLAYDIPKITYPAAARAVRASGKVILDVTIDKYGQVISLAVVSGHPLLIGASMKAALDTNYLPVKIKGEAVQTSGQLVLNFNP